MQKLGKFKNKRLNVIANTNERYVSFTFSQLRFIDSFQFLSTSLDTLVLNLKSCGELNFQQFNNHFKSSDQRKFLMRKGVYPYSFIRDSSKFLVDQLPPKSVFFNTISNCHTSDEDYEHVHQV